MAYNEAMMKGDTEVAADGGVGWQRELYDSRMIERAEKLFKYF
jgi:hypothetical protein